MGKGQGVLLWDGSGPGWDSGAARAPYGPAARRLVGRMLRVAALLGIAGILGFSTLAKVHASPVTLLVTMDKALILKYPPTTETIVVGNPVIADVTMVRNSGVVILTGKGYGETNLVFLDHAGALLSESNLRVQPPATVLVVQRGTDRESYSCHPRCEPMISLGDASQFLGSIISDTKSRDSAAVPTASAAGPPSASPH